MNAVRGVLERITRQKLVIRKDIGPFKRIFGFEDCFILSSSCVLGFELYDMMRIFSTYGDTAVYAYGFSSIINVFPLLCYAELASIQPCIGGPYHYAYNTTVEILAFLVGWLNIQASMAYNASMLKGASRLIDESFFDGTIERGFRKYLGFHFLADYVAPYPDFLAFLLAMIVSGIAAADSAETKLLNNVLFFVNIVNLSVLTVLFLGKMNLDLFLMPLQASWGTLFRAFSSTNSIFNGIVFLTYLGEEALLPDETIPKAMIASFLFCSAWLCVFPILQSLQKHYLQLSRYTPIRSILTAANLASLDFIPMAGISASMYSSSYVHMLYYVRLTVAMSRDGMLMHAFSKLEHINNMPVKPAFLCGLSAGILALMLDASAIWEAGNVANLALTICGPIFVLHLRYMTEIDHIKDKLYRRGTKKPNPYSHYLVWALAISAILLGISISELTVPWFINSRMIPRNFYPLLVISGVSTVICLFFLHLQPQNKVNSYIQVWGVPYTLVFIICIISFLTSYCHPHAVYFTAMWLGVGRGFVMTDDGTFVMTDLILIVLCIYVYFSGILYYCFIVINRSKLEDIQLK